MIRSSRHLRLVFAAALASMVGAPLASAEDTKPMEGDKHLSGMSILGNDESPKSLVIVPWKSSDLGDDLDLTRRFGQDRSALDPEVFRLSLEYHELRTAHQDR